jgi:hypothetical protein
MIWAALVWLVLWSPGELELVYDDRAFDRLMRLANIYAKVPGLKREIADKPEAVAAIMLSLRAYGLAITLPGLNAAFDWIEGRAEPSAQLYQALARAHGCTLTPVVRTAERAVARLSPPDGGDAIEVEFTLADAVDAGRRDEWVDDWGETRDGKRYKRATWVIRRNGQPTEGDPPAWVAAEVAAGKTKRFDAWWNWPADMVWKSAAKRAAKIVIPHIILGADADQGFALPPEVAERPQVAGAVTVVEGPPVLAPAVASVTAPAPAAEQVPAGPPRSATRARAGRYDPPESLYDDLPEAQGYAPNDPGRPFS